MKCRVLAHLAAAEEAFCQKCVTWNVPTRVIEIQMMPGFTSLRRLCFPCSADMLANSEGDPRR